MPPNANEVVAGLGPDAEIVTNAEGAKQSRLDYLFKGMYPLAILSLARVLDYGAKKYSMNNWHGIETDDHLNHLLGHVFAYWAGDRSDDHLGHIQCRAHMALARAQMDGYVSRQADEPEETA